MKQEGTNAEERTPQEDDLRVKTWGGGERANELSRESEFYAQVQPV